MLILEEAETLTQIGQVVLASLDLSDAVELVGVLILSDMDHA